MPIGVQGDGDGCVTEALGQHLDGHPGTQGSGRVAVAQLVDGDRWEPCSVGVVTDAPQEEIGTDRSTDPIDEHPAGVGPQLTGGESFLPLRSSLAFT